MLRLTIVPLNKKKGSNDVDAVWRIDQSGDHIDNEAFQRCVSTVLDPSNNLQSRQRIWESDSNSLRGLAEPELECVDEYNDYSTLSSHSDWPSNPPKKRMNKSEDRYSEVSTVVSERSEGVHAEVSPKNGLVNMGPQCADEQGMAAQQMPPPCYRQPPIDGHPMTQARNGPQWGSFHTRFPVMVNYGTRLHTLPFRFSLPNIPLPFVALPASIARSMGLIPIAPTYQAVNTPWNYPYYGNNQYN